MTPERKAQIIARIRNEQTAPPEQREQPEQISPAPVLVIRTDSAMAVALLPEQPAMAPASTDSTNTHQPAPALDHRAWLCRARTAPRPAPPTPERLAEIITHLRQGSLLSQPNAPDKAYGEDFVAHDENTTSQDGSGATEQTLSTHSHVRDVIAPQKPVQPAPEQTIATVIARIEIARAEIRRTKRETLNEETGELVEKATRAMKHRVRAIVSDVPDALFDAAWKKVNDEWGNYRADLEKRDAVGIALAAGIAARQHANALRRNDPRIAYYAARAQIAAEICARREVDPRDPTMHKRPVTKAQAQAQAKGQTERRSAIATMFSATPQGA